jgi:hypothetical protein
MQMRIILNGSESKQLTLPVSIGSFEDCNICIFSLSLPKDLQNDSTTQFRLEIQEQFGGIVLKDLQKNEFIDIGILEKLGIVLQQMSIKETMTQETVESQVQEKIVKKGNFRAVTIGAIALTLAVIAAWWASRSNQNSNTDLSHVPVEIRPEKPSDLLFGNIPGASQHAKGVKIKLSAAPDFKLSESLLSFTEWGIDAEGEYKIHWNGNEIYSAIPQKSCSKNGCKIFLRLPDKYELKQNTELTFEHITPESSWAIGRIKFVKLKMQTEDERINTENLLVIGEQDFLNRKIANVNLFRSFEKAQKLKELTRTYVTSAEVYGRVQELDKQSTTEVSKIIDEYTFAANKSMSMNDLDATIRKVEEVARLFPEKNVGPGRKLELTLVNLKGKLKK